MTLLENWRNKAYGDATDDKQKEEIWKNYFLVEKGIYENILKNPKDIITCTVAELATKFDTDIQTVTGFLDGINDSLNKPNPIEEMKASFFGISGLWQAPEHLFSFILSIIFWILIAMIVRKRLGLKVADYL